MIEEKLKILEIVKDLTSQQVDDLIKNTEKLWSYLNTDEPLNCIKKQEASRPVIEIISEKVDSDKTLTDPLKKEYTKHMLVSNFIEDQLEKGLNKLCFEIDKKLGIKDKNYQQISDKLQALYMNNLVALDDKHCAFSSGDYVSEMNNDDEPKKPCTDKIILTGIEEKDKEIIQELNEKYKQDIDFSKKELKKLYYVNKTAKNNYDDVPSISEERIDRFKQIEKNVKNFFTNLEKNIPTNE